LLYYYRRELMLMTVSEELAAVEGVPVKRLNLMLTLLTALTVGVAVRIVGALLIVALLVIPPAAARFFSCSPGGMVFRSVLISLISVIAGVSLSAELNIPAGPAVILTASTVFFLLFCAERIGGGNK
jgi:zinc transport system permease protein